MNKGTWAILQSENNKEGLQASNKEIKLKNLEDPDPLKETTN